MDPLLAKFTLTALIIELTPGPNMGYLAALSLAEGRRMGLAAVAGVSLGLALVGVLAVLGLASFIDRIPYAYEALRYLGAGYLLYLAWDAWQVAGGEEAPMGNGAAFRRSLLANILNPKSAVFYVAVLPLFLPPQHADVAGRTALMAAIYVGVATAVHTAIVLFAAALRPYLVDGPHERLVRRLLAASLAIVAIWFFWSTRQ